MKNTLNRIRKKVIPTKQQEKSKNSIAEVALKLISKSCEKFPEIVKVEFGGSFAKGTWLPKKADIDVFVKFKKSTSEARFREISRTIGFESMKKYRPYVRYSEHPYVEAKIKDTIVNVVPCYDVKLGEWKSAADRSPFHTEHMRMSLSDKMKNEVRILKEFLKAQEIYGAEIARQGFSGYVCEVLVLNFGTFENVIKSISTLKENYVIGKSSKKFETPIVIIDPIDSNRNLAAAISQENIGRFILLCRAFMDNTSEYFFKGKKLRKILRNWERIITVEFNFKQRSPDIIWGQIKKGATSIATQMNLAGFNVLKTTVYTDEKNKAFLFFFMEAMEISKVYPKKGPSFFSKEDSSRFISKNSKTTELMWINGTGRIMTLQKRKINNAKEFLNSLLKNIKKSGMPAGLHSDIKRGFKIYVGNKSLDKSIKKEVSELVSINEFVFHPDKKIRK